MASVVDYSLQNPNGSSLMFTVSLSLFSITLSSIFMVWPIRVMPLWFPQLRISPLFLHVGMSVLSCHSSGILSSSITLLNRS